MRVSQLLALLAADLVAGHAAIIRATGNAGGNGSALGVDPATPRDGTGRNPFQQDSTRFKGDAAATFGETLAAGDNDLDAGTKKIMTLNNGEQLPQVTAGGSVNMVLHQVNADGGGPYECMINADGTGQTWANVQVTQQVPGRNGRNRDTSESDVPLAAAVPADQTCTGTAAGQENVCLMRCQNEARAGPFGGVVPIQMAGAQTPAKSRRALAEAVEADSRALRTLRLKMMKRALTDDELAEEEEEEEEEEDEE